MDELKKILLKLKGMSPYNPLIKIFVDYGKVSLNMLNISANEKEEINSELNSYLKSNKNVDEFSIACIRRYFSQEKMMYLNIPYCSYLEERMNMMEFYRESGDRDLSSKKYIYEETVPKILKLLEESSEDSWWLLTWIEEFIIAAKKMDLINFENDDYIHVFFELKKKVIQLESNTAVKLNTNLMNAFGDVMLTPDKIKIKKCECLYKFIMGEDLDEYMKELNLLELNNNTFDVQMELREYIDNLLAPINPYHYLSLYKNNHDWVYAFPDELIEEIRKFISEVFHQPDSSTLASGLTEYLIIKDICNNKEPDPKEIVHKCFPFPIEEFEVISKVNYIKEMLKNGGDDE